MNEHIKLGDLIQVQIRKMGINGEGIGYFQKLAIFVDQGLPNEKLEVEITEVFDNRAVAKIHKILVESPDRILPFCKVYDRCGGCQTQHYDYNKTMIQKRDLIIQSFDRYLKKKINPDIVKNTLGAVHPRNYRNKASLPVQKIKGKNVFGMYAKGSNQFIEIDECPIQNKKINDILKTITSLMDHYQVDAIDPKTKRGYIRSLVVRVSEVTNEAQVSFIMAKKSQRLDQLTEDLIAKEPSIVSVVEVINESLKKPGFFTDKIRLISGRMELYESLGGFQFKLSPEAFFQLNSTQADRFYLEMKRLADLKHHEVAIDAYAGVAPVSHYIHDSAKHVYAIELDPSACESARLSLEANHITNVSVLQSDFNRALNGLKEKKIDVMFFDPPRTGLGHETIDLILSFKPKRLIYGSCNPSTLAKDLSILLDMYELIETVPIDMFPYTSLVESVSLLIQK